MPTKKPVRYRDAGVNIDEADRAVDFIKTAARRTFNRGVLTGIGSFGAMYRLTGWKRPVLVSSADGVGTKLKVAFLANRHDTVGQCLVNHCVNDIGVQGALPLYFSTISRWASSTHKSPRKSFRGWPRRAKRMRAR